MHRITSPSDGTIKTLIKRKGEAVASGEAVLILVPAKPDGQGAAPSVPAEGRRWVYAPVEARIVDFAKGLKPGSVVTKGQDLILMHDAKLELKMRDLLSESAGLEKEIAGLAAQVAASTNEAERFKLATEKTQKRTQLERKQLELKTLAERANADLKQPGQFWVRAPLMGKILTADFREELTGKTVNPSERLLLIEEARITPPQSSP
jgi:biotin carboxyl carrier protein